MNGHLPQGTLARPILSKLLLLEFERNLALCCKKRVMPFFDSKSSSLVCFSFRKKSGSPVLRQSGTDLLETHLRISSGEWPFPGRQKRRHPSERGWLWFPPVQYIPPLLPQEAVSQFLGFFCTLCKKWDGNIRNPCAVNSQSGITGRDASFYSVCNLTASEPV